MSTAHPRPYRKNSTFGPGPRRQLDRNARARFRFLAREHARHGRLPAKQHWVSEALLKRLGDDGQCDPSYETLAADAGCSEKTVGRAIARLAQLGLVTWTRRIVRAGWRCAQTSNGYALHTPENAAVSCEGQNGRPTLKKLISTVSDPRADDEWGRWNAQRQLIALAAMQELAGITG
jgi:hypothetical protein